VPLIVAIENKLGRKPAQASADSGYCRESNLAALEAHGGDGYVAPGRAKHPIAANGKSGGPLTRRVRKKIEDAGFETDRSNKHARYRQFLLRGNEKVRPEWAMICTARPPQAVHPRKGRLSHYPAIHARSRPLFSRAPRA
jgi:hypothetical protein